ncbi:MAG: replicative DNA helicase, partial [Candidatus Hydrogenedentes bacterium]|nr:replicative DNA helicase [Candidatus Hydrogenedentota bacterium]
MATQRNARAEFDRVPPYDEDAERAVLGSMLLNPDMVGTAIEVLRGQPGEIFYFPAHQYIYEAVLSLYRKAKPIDAMLLKEQLLADGHLDDVGGIAYVADLSSVVPTSANMEHYAQIVSEKSILRRLITSCTHIVGEAYDSHDNVQQLLDRAEGDLFRIADQRQTNPIVPISQMLDESVARFEKEMFSDTPITGLATGFDDLDKMTHGFQPSDMIVLAARPSVGKTALALNIARNAAVDHAKKILIFSLEMSKAQLIRRLICTQGQINLRRLQEGYLAKDEFPKIQAAADALLGKPIFIDDSSNIT